MTVRSLLLAAVLAVAAARVEAQAPAFPGGPDGAAVRYGYALVTQTGKLLPHNVNAGMSCSSCHLDAGRTAHASPFRGIFSNYPRWEARTRRVIALQDGSPNASCTA